MLVTWGPTGSTGVPCPLPRPCAQGLPGAMRRFRHLVPARGGRCRGAGRVDAVWTFLVRSLPGGRHGRRDDPLPWPRLLAYSLGIAWIWAGMTPAVLWLTRDATFAPGQRMRGALILGATAAGFVLLSLGVQLLLASATGIVTSGSSPLLPKVESSLLAWGAVVVLGHASRYSRLYRTRHVHASELEARLARTHLQLLELQLQPHFLLIPNTVAELVHTDPDSADQMITRLGRLSGCLWTMPVTKSFLSGRRSISCGCTSRSNRSGFRIASRSCGTWRRTPGCRGSDPAVAPGAGECHPPWRNPPGGPGPHRHRFSPR